MMITPALRTPCLLRFRWPVPADWRQHLMIRPPLKISSPAPLEAAGERSPAAGAVCGFIAEPSWSDGEAFRYEVDPEAGGHWRGADGEVLKSALRACRKMATT